MAYTIARRRLAMGKIPAAMILTAALFLPLSCKQIFTYSLGESVARDEIKINGNLSLDKLIELKNTDYGRTIEGSKAITTEIASKSPAALTALSDEDQAAILEMAINAAADMASIAEALQAYDPGVSDDEALVSTILSSFDTSVDMTAVIALLNNYDPLTSTIPADVIILATAVMLTDALEVMTITDVMTDLQAGSSTNASVQLACDIADDLGGTDTSLSGFDLLELLTGGMDI
jgi:hypothetical protein